MIVADVVKRQWRLEDKAHSKKERQCFSNCIVVFFLVLFFLESALKKKEFLSASSTSQCRLGVCVFAWQTCHRSSRQKKEEGSKRKRWLERPGSKHDDTSVSELLYVRRTSNRAIFNVDARGFFMALALIGRSQLHKNLDQKSWSGSARQANKQITVALATASDTRRFLLDLLQSWKCWNWRNWPWWKVSMRTWCMSFCLLCVICIRFVWPSESKFECFDPTDVLEN